MVKGEIAHDEQCHLLSERFNSYLIDFSFEFCVYALSSATDSFVCRKRSNLAKKGKNCYADSHRLETVHDHLVISSL